MNSLSIGNKLRPSASLPNLYQITECHEPKSTEKKKKEKEKVKRPIAIRGKNMFNVGSMNTSKADIVDDEY